MMMVDQNLVGQCGDGQLAARNKIMDRYCPDWIDNNFSTQKLVQRLLMSFKEHSRVRRLEQEEHKEGMSGACPLIVWRWNEKQEGATIEPIGMPYMFARGPCSPEVHSDKFIGIKPKTTTRKNYRKLSDKPPINSDKFR